MPLFSFAGRLGRLTFTLLWLPLFLGHGVVLRALTGEQGWGLVPQSVGDVIFPAHRILRLSGPELGIGDQSPMLIYVLYAICAAWLILVLAFRRAGDAGIDPWIATPTLVPVLQIGVLITLSLMPSRPAEPGTAPDPTPVEFGPVVVAQGLVVGTALTLATVLLGAIVFGTYGYVMFLVSPFLIGAVTGFIGNYRQDIGAGRTFAMVFAAAALGGTALLLTSLEGVICITLASPLAIGLVGLGGAFGRATARRSRSRAGPVYAVALLPLLFGSESLLPPHADFETVQTIDVATPPARVWQVLVHMDRIDEPRTLPLRLGVAYPLGAEIEGEGVGALRRGIFSTGTALERITTWRPEQELAFMVETNVPAMREMSPYEHVHAPHIDDYFRTGETSFALDMLPDGATRITLRSAHSLRLDPVPYWLPLARWVVTENNARVLAYLKHQAEAPASGS